MSTEDADAWNATQKDIRDAIEAGGTDATVATVAAVEGSAYRRPGAKMLVNDDGVDTGAVTAGCLEPSVVDICESVRTTGESQIKRFDLTDSGEAWGLGLGCNGIIDLLVEPRDESWNAILDASRSEGPAAVVTVIDAGTDTAVGDRVIVDESGIRSVPDRDPVPRPQLTRTGDMIDRIAGTGDTVTVSTGEATLLVDGLAPVPELLLFGSQNDIGPVAALGSRAGFRVTVHAQRAGIDESTFPCADTVRTGHPSTVADGAGEHTYGVVMSHNLVDDRIAVQTLLQESAVPYVGVMGPRKRFDRLREELNLTADQLERVAAPVGLDLGGGTPSEIALSIVSEVVAIHNGQDGGRLRDRSGPIHSTDPSR